jgi:hypothetical protein
MPIQPARWTLVGVGLLGYAAFAWQFDGDVPGLRNAQAQEREKATPAGKANRPTPMHFGVDACNTQGCHGGDPPKNWIAGKGLICRCIEAIDWHKKDKHADAYRVLTGARGQQMAKILGYDVTDPKGKGRACLVCHGVVIDDPKLLAASKENQFKIEEGVNCVACHGAFEEWVSRHSILVSARKWRPLSRAEKQAQGGMRDLRDPLKRAALCTSCHIGNLEEGKLLTHAMYAAGHPPLPGFEAAAFSDQMPRHWEYLREKKDPEVQKVLGYKPGDLEQAQLIVIGAAVSLRQTMALLEAQAKACMKATKDDDKVLDYANFDCYACHHDLKTLSGAQQPQIPRKAGRVAMRPWSLELVKLALVATGKAAEQADKELKAIMQPVHVGFDARPFGDPEKVAFAAGVVKKWADQLARKLDGQTVYAKESRALLGQFPTLYLGPQDRPRLLDYDSARQVGWAFEEMYKEVSPKRSPQIDKRVSVLEDYLKLRLAKGREKGVEDELKESLEKIQSYDPIRFRELFGNIFNALNKKTP